ncbi:hypothetical protein B0T16DRAFT_446866 [Cercophora newfieldiana]|uniref:Uncharacterized protein n=1 Tax=Cercophora newfieldiana TaxID=92897 RepID=A0AA39Y6M6_9PEZI|nr:hypothetical protein B0T16DRAFT_446866 [Cercophora newfieldiana]
MADNVTLRYIGPFGFATMYQLLLEVQRNTTDPLASPYLEFDPATRVTSFSNSVCHLITNSTSDGNSWSIYEHQDIWNRIVTWKLPLITLLFQFARPPLESSAWTNTNVFVLMRLIGNPIGTISSLLATLAACHRRALGFKKKIEQTKWRLERGDSKRANLIRPKQDMLWKAFGLIQISYDEWHGENVSKILTDSLETLLINPNPQILSIFITAASELAADRTTSLLPVFIAQAAFIFAIAAAYWRVIGVPPQLHSWTNVEAYSIAMSAPFLYVAPAVFLSAIIGVSQTETSVPRILNEFREKLRKEGVRDLPPRIPQRSPRDFLLEAGSTSKEDKPITLQQRISYGGLYAWRPSIFSLRNLHNTWHHHLLAASFVVFSVLVAAWISYRVPPEGFDCRTAAQTALLANWIFSFFLDFAVTTIMECFGHLLPNPASPKKINMIVEKLYYPLTFIKDTTLGLAAISSILVTQLGIFNRCDCFTLWGKVPVMLPEIPQVKEILMRRIAGEWPAVTFLWIVLEIGICGGIWWWRNEGQSVHFPFVLLAIVLISSPFIRGTLRMPADQAGPNGNHFNANRLNAVFIVFN